MSHLLTSDGQLVRDLWPKGIGNLDGEHLSPASLQDWQKVPSTFSEICSWAQIARDPSCTERRRENILVYCNPPASSSPTIFPVAIRIQGILEACCLQPLGNWKGEPAAAHKACQTITLRSNGDDRPWAPIHLAIRHIRQLIQRQLRGDSLYEEPSKEPFGNLRLFHRVFVKRQDDNPIVQMPAVDDPNQFYPAVARQWALGDRLQIGRRAENGKCISSSHLSLSPGDFVDVGITFEIVRQREKNGAPTFKIHLGFSHILQLASVDNLKKQEISDQKRSRPADMEIDQPRAKVQKTLTGDSSRCFIPNCDIMTTRHLDHDDTGAPPAKKLNYYRESPSKTTSTESSARSMTVSPESTSASKTMSPESTTEENPVNAKDELSSSPHLTDFDDNIKRRVKICEDFTSKENLIYSVDHMLADLAWGPNMPFGNLSHVLCSTSVTEKKPVTFWIVGQSSSEYAEQMNIRVLPTTPGTGNKISGFLAQLSNSSISNDETGWGLLKIAAWQSKFINGAKAEATPFKAVFDARDGYKDKKLMHTLSLQDIKQRDVVLVEASIKRYSVERKTYSGWQKWRAYLELKAVSLIATAPQLAKDEKDGEVSISF
ncbi:hypothetical protein BJ138DRAFT_1104782 [Hygrophoropsis aurantiaca]|uniref:Uncharacterized protein n=1 Tax=Hygrophoropsis aurantiaca TaxID=72124 RepID=A0ACB8A2D8_9AGAM|nr:hypothetical protein BJ138DRAFT_1104782 [Hygrophoropsis aurantiaca]